MTTDTPRLIRLILIDPTINSGSVRAPYRHHTQTHRPPPRRRHISSPTHSTAADVAPNAARPATELALHTTGMPTKGLSFHPSLRDENTYVQRFRPEHRTSIRQ